MTRARTTKALIRARMAKTGERYTVARRHTLAAPAASASAPPRNDRKTTPAAPAGAGGEARGAVSGQKVIERTGHDVGHWFALLDRFGAVEKGHTAAARHLRVDHGVDAWYSQGITVAYERARGLRAINQRVGGTYEVSATKTVDLDVAHVRSALEATTAMSAWTRGLDRALVAALVGGVRGPGATGFTPASKASFRCRFRWDGLPVEVMLSPRPSNRTQVVVVCTRLPSSTAVDNRRAAWRMALAALQASLHARDLVGDRPSRARRRPATRRATRA